MICLCMPHFSFCVFVVDSSVTVCILAIGLHLQKATILLVNHNEGHEIW